MTSVIFHEINAADLQWILFCLFAVYVCSECAVPIDIVTEIIKGDFKGPILVGNPGTIPNPFTADPLMKLRKNANIREKRDLQQQLKEMENLLEKIKKENVPKNQDTRDRNVKAVSPKEPPNFQAAVLTTPGPRVYKPTLRSLAEQDMRRQKNKVTWDPLDPDDGNNPLNKKQKHWDEDVKQWYQHELRGAEFVNDDYQPFLGPKPNPHPYPSVQHGHLIFLTQIIPILKSMALIEGIDAPPGQFRVHKDDTWAFDKNTDKIF